MKLKLDDIIEILNTEIVWCLDHPEKAFHKEYRKGFTNGLIQAKYLISTFSDLQVILDETKRK